MIIILFGCSYRSKNALEFDFMWGWTFQRLNFGAAQREECKQSLPHVNQFEFQEPTSAAHIYFISYSSLAVTQLGPELLKNQDSNFKQFGQG